MHVIVADARSPIRLRGCRIRGYCARVTTLWRYADPAEFLAVAEPVLAADPVGTTIIGAAVQQLVTEASTPAPATGRVGAGPAPWFAAVTDVDGRVSGLAMRTGRYHPVLHGLTPEVAAELAERILDTGEVPAGVQGEAASARAFAQRVAALRGGRVEVTREFGLHHLRTLRPPVGVPGRARRATESDLDLLVDWLFAFLDEVEDDVPPVSGDPQERRAAETQIQRARLPHSWLWVDNAGVPVSLASSRAPAFGVARIGPVYTPPDRRGHGYAAAVTAHVSAHHRAVGSEVVLFTDLANPTSNGVYRRIGFVQVGERVALRIASE